MSKLYIVPKDQRPAWLEYPHSFSRLIEQGLIHLTPWHIMESDKALIRAHGLAERYPERDLFPFAYRQDNDDVACWGNGNGKKVFIVHDFASAGWEIETEFEDVWKWFRSAVDETIEWD